MDGWGRWEGMGGSEVGSTSRLIPYIVCTVQRRYVRAYAEPNSKGGNSKTKYDRLGSRGSGLRGSHGPGVCGMCVPRKGGGNIQARGTAGFSGWSGAMNETRVKGLRLCSPSRISGWDREVCPRPGYTRGLAGLGDRSVRSVGRAAPSNLSERDPGVGSLALGSCGRRVWISRYAERCGTAAAGGGMWMGGGWRRDGAGCRNKPRTGKTGVGSIQIGSICMRLIPRHTSYPQS